MLNVLYVDDEPINLELFEISYQRDFNILKSSSGKQALTIINEQQVDVVVTDLKMPVMNGIDFIKKVKEINKNMNCILLTGYYENNIITFNNIAIFQFNYCPNNSNT